MLTTWRIVRVEYVATAFDGEGARIFGGRWNSPGTALIHTASSVSLAILEILVKVNRKEPLARYVLVSCTFDHRLVATIDVTALPEDWKRQPPPTELRAIGDKWVTAAQSAVLRVPSAVVPSEWNYLLNPAHAGFSKIVIGPARPLEIDRRLLL